LKTLRYNYLINYFNDDEKFDLQVELILSASQFDYRIEPHPLSNEDFNTYTPFSAEIKRTGIEVKTLITDNKDTLSK
jgi:hypothetical protein